jgi:quinol monooxygenase YgiN
MPQISRLTLETGGNLPAILVYQLCVKPGFEKMVHDELLTLLHKSRLEVECLHFDLYRLADSRFYFSSTRKRWTSATWSFLFPVYF